MSSEAQEPGALASSFCLNSQSVCPGRSRFGGRAMILATSVLVYPLPLRLKMIFLDYLQLAKIIPNALRADLLVVPRVEARSISP